MSQVVALDFYGKATEPLRSTRQASNKQEREFYCDRKHKTSWLIRQRYKFNPFRITSRLTPLRQACSFRDIKPCVDKKLKFISITAGGLHKINVSGEPTSRLDVDKNELTATYQDWSREDFTSYYSKAVIAIRDTADSKTRELKESISTQKSFVAANSKELTF